MTGQPTPDRQVAMAHAAYAEAGYPMAQVRWSYEHGELESWRAQPDPIPDDIHWKVGALVAFAAGRPHPCRACWFGYDQDACTHDFRLELAGGVGG